MIQEKLTLEIALVRRLVILLQMLAARVVEVGGNSVITVFKPEDKMGGYKSRMSMIQLKRKKNGRSVLSCLTCFMSTFVREL